LPDFQTTGQTPLRGDARERSAALELFKTTVIAGVVAVRTGRTDCATVEAWLTKLERLGTV
jgi:hypothetical protein